MRAARCWSLLGAGEKDEARNGATRDFTSLLSAPWHGFLMSDSSENLSAVKTKCRCLTVQLWGSRAPCCFLDISRSYPLVLAPIGKMKISPCQLRRRHPFTNVK